MGIRDLLALAVERGASDLHLSAGLPPMLRVDGAITPLDQPPLDTARVRCWIGELAAGEADARQALDADYCVEVADLARFRVNVFRHQRGAGAVLRTVPTRVPALRELGLGPVFERIADARRGLVLVTGPTGSGKSTTLAAMIDHVNRTRREHILTIEDPIEFVHAARRCLISQREIGRHTAGFADALRAALREDPDVILVGEMRDPQTIRLALTAAETGHLVFATLHTASASKSIDRIVDVFPGGEKETIRAMLSESLHAVVAQTLERRVGGGRVAVSEIMLATPAVRNLIREHKVAQLHSTIGTSAAAGMQTREQHLRRLAEEGVLEVIDRRTATAGDGSCAPGHRPRAGRG